jgi:lysophospholipase L1-like esterase
MPLTRRSFLATAGAGVVAACLPRSRSATVTRDGPAANAVVLFQGDSITDGGRQRNVAEPNRTAALGAGYPLLVASAMLEAYPERGLRFFNRGVSGNKVPDLRARWATDTIALAPTILSVLVGVNDFWHKRLNGYPGTVADYESGYTALLEETKQSLPAVHLVVIEPFVLRTGAVDASWFPEFDERRAAAARVAKQTGAIWVPMQAELDALSAKVSPAYWAADGVHPTPAGHALIADRWRAAVGF